MNSSGTGASPLRFVLAFACFAVSLFFLRAALRRLLDAVGAWLLAAVFFLIAAILFLAGGWRLLREWLRAREPQ